MATEDERDETEASRRVRLRRLPAVLRLSAIVLIPVGFVGSVTNETPPVSIESAFSVVFLAGAACAVASIYLGIFLHEIEE